MKLFNMKECLSPRSANIPSKAPPTTKPKDKNHASPPPKYVIQPQGLLGEPGEKYSMGRELGKGGFAICYEGTLLGQKYGKGSTFALKIVKANMGLKKMEEKVIAPYASMATISLLVTSSVQNCRFIPRCATLTLSNSIEHSLSKRIPISS